MEAWLKIARIGVFAAFVRKIGWAMAIPGLPGGEMSSTREPHLFPLKIDAYDGRTAKWRLSLCDSLGTPLLARGCACFLGVPQCPSLPFLGRDSEATEKRVEAFKL